MLIRSKLALAFGTICALICGTGALALFINSAVEADVAQIAHGSVEKPKAARGMYETMSNLRLHWQEWEFQRRGGAVTEAAVQTLIKALARDVEQFEHQLGESRKIGANAVQLATAEQSEEEINDAEDSLAQLNEISGQFAEITKMVEQQTRAGSEQVRGALPPLEKLYDELLVLVKEYESSVAEHLHDEAMDVDRALGRANEIIFCSILVILMVSGLLAWFISGQFARPLNLLSKGARSIGEGRFGTTINVDSKDEFGLLAQSFNRMSVALQTTTVSRNFVDGVLNSMPSSVIVARADGMIKTVNPATLQMLGSTESELVGQPLEHVLRGSGMNLQSIFDGAAEGALSDVELVYQKKSGISIPVSFSASLLRDVSGAMEGLVCVAHDISERKQAEAELAKTHRALLETSRLAGMAEVASGVLHNVGNVLNSVTIASSCLTDGLRQSKAGNLSKVVTLLQQHAEDLGAYLTSDPKGKKLPGYLAQLAEHLAAEQAAALQELAHLQKNIGHIKDIVNMQQGFAKVSGLVESLQVADLMEDALHMNASFARHDIMLIKEFAPVPSVMVEKHKVLQILVNLLRNAKHACDDSRRPDKRLTLRLSSDSGHIRIVVSDNGIGIPPENLTRIFEHGFTTKKSGHGFGLHSGALAAREMGGSLTVYSHGVGHGATFTLELPCLGPDTPTA